MKKKSETVTSDYGAQQLRENVDEFRKAGFVRAVDGAFIALEERGGGAGKAKRARVVTQNVIDRYFYAAPPLITWRMW